MSFSKYDLGNGELERVLRGFVLKKRKIVYEIFYGIYFRWDCALWVMCKVRGLRNRVMG